MDNKQPNPFEEMEQHQIKNFFQGQAERKVKAGLDGTMGTVRMLSSIADVFITRMVDTIVNIAGKNTSSSDDEAMNGEGRPTIDMERPKDPKYPNQ